jgi:FMN-dependent oxidoreductase (nitrilotriacetate monooxygenase family)
MSIWTSSTSELYHSLFKFVGLRPYLYRRRLWESSWGPESIVWDKENGVAFDPSKIRKIEHKGKYFNISGRNQVHPSPQRTPVLFQAGTSKTGTAFASKHAEAIFLNTASIAQAKDVVANLRAQAAANGRDPKSLKFFPCIVPVVGRTEEEARAKYEKAVANADPVAGLAQFSGYTGIDFSQYALDEPLDLSGSKQDLAIQSVFKSFAASGEAWTPRRLGMRMALGGLHPCPVGSAEQVADVFEAWVREADVDGFNVASVTNPGSWEDVVDLLRPELVRGGTFRENLLGRKELRDDHYGSRFKWRDDDAKQNGQNGVNGVNGH